jgi:hypothetical protein
MAIACDLDKGTPTWIDVRGGSYPGMHISKVTFGVASDSPDVVLGSTTTATSDGTTGEFILFYVSQGVIVDDLKVLRNDAFSTGGTSVYSIGDSDLDGYAVSTDLVLTTGTTGTMYSMKAMSGSTGVAHSVAYVGGRYYNSDAEQDSDYMSHIVLSDSTAANTIGGKATCYLYWHAEDAVG